MNPYIAIAIQSVLTILSAFFLAAIGYMAVQRSNTFENGIVRQRALENEVADLKAENEGIRKRLANVEASYGDLVLRNSSSERDLSLCRAARKSMIEAALQLEAQIRDLKQVPRIDMGALMSGMNETAL